MTRISDAEAKRAMNTVIEYCQETRGSECDGCPFSYWDEFSKGDKTRCFLEMMGPRDLDKYSIKAGEETDYTEIMKVVASYRGVKLGEAFKCGNDRGGCIYRITKDGLQYKETKEGKWHREKIDARSKYSVILEKDSFQTEKVWTPEVGKNLYIVTSCGLVQMTSFDDKMMLAAYVEMGNAFQTREEAEAKKDIILMKMKQRI